MGRRERRRAARLARGRRSATTWSPGRPRPAWRPAVEASTGWCCSTCPTSTRACWRTAPRPSGCSSSSTCSCGSPTRRSTPTPGCTTTTSRALTTHDAVTVVVLNQADRLTPDAVAPGPQRPGAPGERGRHPGRAGDRHLGPHGERASTTCGSGWPTRSRRSTPPGTGWPATSGRSPGAARGRRRQRAARWRDASTPSWSTRCPAPPACPTVVEAVERDYRQAGLGAHRVAVHPLGARPAARPAAAAAPQRRPRRGGRRSSGRHRRATCAPCSAARRCRRPPRPPGPRSSWPPAGSGTGPGRACPPVGRGGGATPPPRPVRSWPTPSTGRSSAPRCGRGTRCGGGSSARAAGCWPGRRRSGSSGSLVLVVMGWLRAARDRHAAAGAGALPVAAVRRRAAARLGCSRRSPGPLARVGARAAAELIRHGCASGRRGGQRAHRRARCGRCWTGTARPARGWTGRAPDVPAGATSTAASGRPALTAAPVTAPSTAVCRLVPVVHSRPSPPVRGA